MIANISKVWVCTRWTMRTTLNKFDHYLDDALVVGVAENPPGHTSTGITVLGADMCALAMTKGFPAW